MGPRTVLGSTRLGPILLLALVFFVLLGSLHQQTNATAWAVKDRWWASSTRSGSSLGVDTVILMSESRALHVPDDPDVYLSSWTLAALQNHLYAKALGAHFIYYQMTPPLIDGKAPPAQFFPKKEGYCKHRTLGWRTAHFCRIPLAWNLLRTDKAIQNLAYVDSDVIFRSPNLSVYRHFDQLSNQRPFGVLTNRPYDLGPCSGYWFVARGREVSDPIKKTARGAVEDFLLEWWNEDGQKTDFFNMDQGTLRRVMGGDYTSGGKTGPPRKHLEHRVLLLDEWTFELKSEDQMLLHVGHKVPDREARLAAAWAWGDEYPLHDRPRLQRLLAEVDARTVDTSFITENMPLPGEVVFE